MQVRSQALANSRLADLGDDVLYHSLLGLTSGRQVCGRFVRNGDYSLKWIAATKCAQWHS
jgi:hypothetical protein